ncbi:hypothetical protein [Bdellovibrio sp. HCB2-146]|uniref:hypothetical protein n=1 Tax=Bdellovibrio sp. HCB2-146 TaxID=3394362 RepID=UPI0039BD8090
MISSTKTSMQNYSLLLLTTIALLAEVAPCAPDYRPVKMSSFRSFQSSGGTLVVSKDSKIITLIKHGYSLTTILMPNSQVKFQIRYLRHGREYIAHATTKNQIGLLVNNLQVMQNEAACTPSLKDSIDELLKSDLTEKIEDFAYSDKFVDSSCESVADELRRVAANEFNPSESYLVKCLNSKEVAAKLNKNPEFAAIANRTIASYMAEIEEMEKGTSAFKIKCASAEKAAYDEKERAIIFPLQKDGLAIDQCKTINQVFSHEILHHAGVNEPDAKIFDSICGNVLKVEALKNPLCKSVYSNKLLPEGAASASAAMLALKKNNKVEQKKAVEVLKQEIKTAEFVPVQDADIQEITNPTTPERYNRSVDRVYTAMSTNLEKMAEPLNRAIAASVNTAEAATTTASTSSSKVQSTYKKSSLLEVSTRSPASNSRASANEEYTVEEILADKYNIPVESVRAAAAGSSELPTAATTTPNTANARQAKQQAQPRGGNSRELAGAGSAGTNAGNSATQDGVPGRSTSNGTRANARQPANTGGSVVQDNTVKDMSSFNEIRGERYRRIQERYTDPEFAKDLAKENLGLEYRSKNMTIRIGDMSNTRKALFRDDGSALKKVTGAR